MNQESQNELVSISGTTQLTFHQLQDIYHSLTGRFERISQQFDRPYIVKFEDFEQLHERINQCCIFYGARVKNESIIVYHVHSTKEEFSSFERFKIYNKSYTTPIENVTLEYNILVIPAGTTRAIQYKIRINLVSRSGIREKDLGMFVGPIDFLKLMGRPDGLVSVEYSDYAAARHFLTQINEWYEALEFSPELKWLSKVQGVSHWLRQIIPATLIITMLVSVAHFYSLQALEESSSGIVSSISRLAALAVVLWLLGTFLGRFIEHSIDRIQPVSSVIINRGDQRAVDKWKKSNVKNSVIASFGIVGSIVINVLSNYIYQNLLPL